MRASHPSRAIVEASGSGVLCVAKSRRSARASPRRGTFAEQSAPLPEAGPKNDKLA